MSSIQKIAVFPGSFDPITKGHESVILRGTEFFDKIIVALGTNTKKKYMFSKEQRLTWLQEIFKNNDKVEVKELEGLTVDFCQKNNAKFILRGLRNTTDFNYEKAISNMNKNVNGEIETIFLITEPNLGAISSSIIRELIISDSDISPFVPEAVKI